MEGRPALGGGQGGGRPVLQQHPSHLDPVCGDASPVERGHPCSWAQEVETDSATSVLLQEAVKLGCISKADKCLKLGLQGGQGLRARRGGSLYWR